MSRVQHLEGMKHLLNNYNGALLPGNQAANGLS